ncbi:MAG TPA: monofunctional biosynthetic peptidoglycan transglycosylase [Vicinamibacterales bacterium]|jgi:monofunctional biosynthetic peptidoglycan transglycosylase|nr:monofunctional biosynthetic peptidoglycan transglycosylase [Vicinamibacterales bacterium]
MAWKNRRRGLPNGAAKPRAKAGRKAGFVRKAANAIWAIAAIGFACLSYAYLTLPDVRPLATKNPKTTAFMELRAEEAKASGKNPRRVQRWVTYSRISPNLTRAVLVAEDDAFWQHEGVDFAQIQESLEMDLARGQFVRGASTITQQLAKNLYLSPSRNPIRKFRELIIARRLEAELKKARILEIYLNVIEWGDGIYGAEAASRSYFSTGASSLNPSQAALLAGAIVNPRLLNPARPTKRLLTRQHLILGRMGAVAPPPAEPEHEPAPEPEPADPKIEIAPGDDVLQPDAASPQTDPVVSSPNDLEKK